MTKRPVIRHEKMSSIMQLLGSMSHDALLYRAVTTCSLTVHNVQFKDWYQKPRNKKLGNVERFECVAMMWILSSAVLYMLLVTGAAWLQLTSQGHINEPIFYLQIAYETRHTHSNLSQHLTQSTCTALHVQRQMAV